MIKCPKCGNDNASMIDTYGHRREQMDCNCAICGHSWVHIHHNIPSENLIPKEIRKK